MKRAKTARASGARINRIVRDVLPAACALALTRMTDRMLRRLAFNLYATQQGYMPHEIPALYAKYEADRGSHD